MRKYVVFGVTFLVMALCGCSYERTGREGLHVRGGHVSEPTENHTETVRYQEELLNKQEEELREQDKEIEDVKRQKYHNDAMRNYE